MLRMSKSLNTWPIVECKIQKLTKGVVAKEPAAATRFLGKSIFQLHILADAPLRDPVMKINSISTIST